MVKRLVDARPWIDVVKRSAYIEGARMAFARVKMQWEKMKATEIATAGPPEGVLGSGVLRCSAQECGPSCMGHAGSS